MCNIISEVSKGCGIVSRYHNYTTKYSKPYSGLYITQALDRKTRISKLSHCLDPEPQIWTQPDMQKLPTREGLKSENPTVTPKKLETL